MGGSWGERGVKDKQREGSRRVACGLHAASKLGRVRRRGRPKCSYTQQDNHMVSQR